MVRGFVKRIKLITIIARSIYAECFRLGFQLYLLAKIVDTVSLTVSIGRSNPYTFTTSSGYRAGVSCDIKKRNKNVYQVFLHWIVFIQMYHKPLINSLTSWFQLIMFGRKANTYRILTDKGAL